MTAGMAACGLLLLACGSFDSAAQAPPVAAAPIAAPPAELSPGDQVTMAVYGQPDLNTTTYIAEDGTLRTALAGAVPVAGLSPAEAARRVEAALRDGKFLVDPHVTITLVETRRVSVVGEVRMPGRFPIDASTTVLDLIAAAGGATEQADETAYIIRADSAGNVTRLVVKLNELENPGASVSMVRLKGGDTLVVPHAPEFQIYGEVNMPNTFRLKPGMHVFEAIAKAGGVTLRGSSHRIEIKRKRPDGSFATIGAGLDDLIQPGDVIRVKESIF